VAERERATLAREESFDDAAFRRAREIWSETKTWTTINDDELPVFQSESESNEHEDNANSLAGDFAQRDGTASANSRGTFHLGWEKE